MMEIVSIALLAYLIGSFPTAFLLLRARQARDIRREGTGNVGALNAFEVSRSKSTGLVVLLADFLKGAAAFLIARAAFSGAHWNDVAAGVAAVAGHNFSPWIGFKGGRGLATAAGVAAIALPICILLWVLLWCLFYLITRNIHWGNILASVATPVLFAISLASIEGTRLLLPERTGAGAPAAALVSGIFILVLIKHVGPLKTLLHARKPTVEST